MKAISPTHVGGEPWILKAELGDHLPNVIILIHNERAFEYKIRKEIRS